MSTSILCIPWQRRFSKALRPFSGDVYGWVLCAKTWQLREALAVMRRALREFTVEGIATTIPIHQQIFNTAEFTNGTVDTTFIERTFLKPKG